MARVADRLSVADLERRFRGCVLEGHQLDVLGIDVGPVPEQADRARWPELRRLMAEAFKGRARDE